MKKVYCIWGLAVMAAFFFGFIETVAADEDSKIYLVKPGDYPYVGLNFESGGIDRDIEAITILIALECMIRGYYLLDGKFPFYEIGAPKPTKPLLIFIIGKDKIEVEHYYPSDHAFIYNTVLYLDEALDLLK